MFFTTPIFPYFAVLAVTIFSCLATFLACDFLNVETRHENSTLSWIYWHLPVIPATRETAWAKIVDPSQKQNTKQKGWGRVQMVEHFCNMCEAVSSILSTEKRKNKGRNERKKERELKQQLTPYLCQ
jgi:hypothetical protein